MNEPSRKLTVEEVLLLNKEVFCYGWWRNGKYLYIGVTTNGTKRFWEHQVLGVADEFHAGDEIHFWDMEVNKEVESKYGKKMVIVQQKAQAWELEAKLIALHLPEFNANGTGKHRENKACGFCGVMFPAQRHWQLFCSKTCREQHWIKKGKEGRTKQDSVIKLCINSECKQEFLLEPEDFNKEGNGYCPDCRLKVENSWWFNEQNKNPVVEEPLSCKTSGCENTFKYDATLKFPYHCETCRQQMLESRLV